jgi:hypothetical protein
LQQFLLQCTDDAVLTKGKGSNLAFHCGRFASSSLLPLALGNRRSLESLKSGPGYDRCRKGPTIIRNHQILRRAYQTPQLDNHVGNYALGNHATRV